MNYVERRTIVQDDIMQALRSGGGLILTNRQVGKTTCLLRYMMETPNCALVVANTVMEDYSRVKAAMPEGY